MTVMASHVIENEELEDSENSSSDLEASNEDSVDETGNDDTTGTANAAWADSISRILKTKKSKGKKTLVLSKAKKISDVKKQTTKPAGFEVATADGEIKEEKIEVEDNKEEQPPRKKKRELPNVRVKPNILDKDRERTLTKIATKGVVQLFNAVRMQQKDISKKLEEAGPLEVKKEKVLKSIYKRAFLDVLMGEKSQSVDDHTSNRESKTETDPTWSVLREDFMMGAKLKDWDKELEPEPEKEVEVESD